MRTTRVFKSGNSQAVRLPKDFCIESSEVEIFKRDHDIVIRAIPANLADAFKLLISFSDDFFENGREDTFPQKRDFFE